MPVVSEFNGIRITIYLEDREQHSMPHFHAYYAESAAVFSIITLEVIASTKNFPSRVSSVIREWTTKHRRLLKKNWYRVKHQKPVIRI